MSNTELWDVYIWPMDDSSYIVCKGRNLTYDQAMAITEQYMDGPWDSYMVPAGQKIYF